MKIFRVAFKKVRLIRAEKINFTGFKGVHIVARYQCPFPFLYPGNLRLFMTVQMRIKVGHVLGLSNDTFIVSYRDSKLQYLHSKKH
jgi:hypothetical protein